MVGHCDGAKAFCSNCSANGQKQLVEDRDEWFYL